MVLECILHSVGKTSTETVKLFDDEMWQKVMNIKNIRLSKVNTHRSKYYTMCMHLPSEKPDSPFGYHTDCYKKFTSVTNEKQEACADTARAPFPPSNSTSKSITSSGIFDKTCLFCDKARKRIKCHV